MIALRSKRSIPLKAGSGVQIPPSPIQVLNNSVSPEYLALKTKFFTIARGSTYEVVAIIDILKDDLVIDEDEYNEFYMIFEEVSKMLLGLINSLK